MPTDRLLTASLAIAFAASTQAQTHVYVDDDAQPGGDGLTWQTAFNDLHDAINLARTLGQARGEIRIAGGTYKPDRGTGDTTMAFLVPTPTQFSPQYTLKGGYAGLQLPSTPDSRNPDLFPTTLEGDLFGDDTADPGTREDNSNTLIVLGDETSTSFQPLSAITLEGLRFTGASSGAVRGVVSGITLTFNECRLYENQGSTGSAMSLRGANLFISNTVIQGNSSHPSAQGIGDAAVVLTNCNTLINDSSFGFNVIANSNAGAVRLTGGEAYINDTLFLGNYAGKGGGAIGCQAARLVADRCEFFGNTATGNAGGGAVRVGADSVRSSVVSNSTFQYNESIFGGAVYSAGPLNIQDCVFDQNTANSGGAFAGTATILTCSFTRNHADSAGGAAFFADGAHASACEFIENNTGGSGGAVALSSDLDESANVWFLGCDFIDNEAVHAGGAIQGPASIRDSYFESNTAQQDGGAIAKALLLWDSTVIDNLSRSGVGGGVYHTQEIVGCEIISNQARRGGGIADANLIEATFISENYGVAHAGGVLLEEDVVSVIRDSVFHNNRVGSFSTHTDLYKNHNEHLDILRSTFVQTYPNPRVMIGLNDGENWLESNIIWATHAGPGAQITTGRDTPTAFIHNNFYGGTNGGVNATWIDDLYFLGGNISANPRFVDAATGDVRLNPGSPCIDAGYVFGSIETDDDVYGQSRRAHDDPGMTNIGYGQGGYLDIGAVEFQGTSCFADVNSDGNLTPADFSAWASAYNRGDFIADQNRDGVITPSDFSAWVSNYNTGCP